MIDLNLIERGADFEELRKTYVIFICLKDPFDRGSSIYTFENRCMEYPDLAMGDFRSSYSIFFHFFECYHPTILSLSPFSAVF